MDSFDWDATDTTGHTLQITLKNGDHDEVTDVVRLDVANTFTADVTMGSTFEVNGTATFRSTVDTTNGGLLYGNVAIDEGTWD
jgi:hypothetical protein